MTRKPRSDSVLQNLPGEQKEKLRQALLAGMSYTAACDLAKSEFGVHTAPSSMRRFWKNECLPRVIRRQSLAEERAKVNPSAATAPAETNKLLDAAKSVLESKFVSLGIMGIQKPSEFKVVTDLFIRERKMCLEEKQQKLRERAVNMRESELFGEEFEGAAGAPAAADTVNPETGTQAGPLQDTVQENSTAGPLPA